MKTLEIISGERIALKLLDNENLSQEYIDWMKDEEVLRFLTGRTKEYSREELEQYVMEMNDSSVNYMFGIFLNSKNIHIGNIKIGSIDTVGRFADVGLLIGKKNMWGKGYATEAIRLVTQYAFDKLNLNKLTAGMVADNIGSYKAFLKVGYTEVESYVGKELLNGHYVDIKQVEKCIASVN